MWLKFMKTVCFFAGAKKVKLVQKFAFLFFKLAKFDVNRLYLFPDFLNVGQCVRKRLEWANVAKLVENSLLSRLILETASKRSGNNVCLVVLINVASIDEATFKTVCFRLE